MYPNQFIWYTCEGDTYRISIGRMFSGTLRFHHGTLLNVQENLSETDWHGKETFKGSFEFSDPEGRVLFTFPLEFFIEASLG